jgi:hypothetical protein
MRIVSSAYCMIGKSGPQLFGNGRRRMPPSQALLTIVSAFRNPGVPGPTSKLSSRAPAQMGRREMEREGGKEPEGGRRER